MIGQLLDNEEVPTVILVITRLFAFCLSEFSTEEQQRILDEFPNVVRQYLAMLGEAPKGGRQ